MRSNLGTLMALVERIASAALLDLNSIFPSFAL
jgi:hypothetical protein